MSGFFEKLALNDTVKNLAFKQLRKIFEGDSPAGLLAIRIDPDTNDMKIEVYKPGEAVVITAKSAGLTFRLFDEPGDYVNLTPVVSGLPFHLSGETNKQIKQINQNADNNNTDGQSGATGASDPAATE